MKYFSKFLLAIIIVATVSVSSCTKDSIPSYASGTAPVLSSSASKITPSIADSSNTVVKFSWTNPNYATDSSTVKYVLEMDTTGSNFSNPISLPVTGVSSVSLTGSQIDSIILTNLQLAADTTYSIDIRLVSSYANNNQQFISNKITVNASAYIPPFPNVPPNPVPEPTSGMLFLVGGATPGGWNNPVPVPSQQFTQVTPDYYTLITYLTGGTGQEYLFLPVNGDWSNKFAVQDNTVTGLSFGGYFGFNYGQNFPAYQLASGTYLIRVRFDLGYFDLVKL